MEITNHLWNALIPVEISYTNSNSTAQNRRIFTTLLPRNSYLYLHLPQVLAFFQIPLSKLTQAWFESGDEIVGWSIPLDVHYNSQNSRTYFLTLQLGICKSSSIRMYHSQLSDSFWEKHWRNTIKEACYVLNRSCNVVLAMSLQDGKDWWNSVISQRVTIFEKHFKKLVPKDITKVPVKIYRVSGCKMVDYEQINAIGGDLKDLTEVGDNRTIFIVHGVEIPPDTGIIELYKIMKHFDGFLHVVIKDIYISESRFGHLENSL